MDRHHHTFLLRHRHDLLVELCQIFAQTIGRDVAISIQHAPEALAVIDEFTGRHPFDEIALETCQIAFAHRLQALARGLHPLGRVVCLGARTRQDKDIVDAELDRIEAQRRPAMGHRIVEIRPRPVGDGHEIVADGAHPGAGDIADRGLVIFDQCAEIAAARFHMLMHYDAFNDRPFKAGLFDFVPALVDLVLRPGASIIEVVQGGDDACCTCLPHMGERHRIVRTEPPPGLFHWVMSPRA